MRLATFLIDGHPRVGAVTERGLIPFRRELGPDVGALLRNGASLQTLGDLPDTSLSPVDPSSVRYLPPVVSPPKIICVGLNYADHTKESPYEQPDYPTLFGRFTSSLTGHGSPIVRPSCSDSLDYEGELAVVLGRGGRHISKARALDCVFGYSVFNDGSVREYQFKSPQWTVGKNFDDTGAFGPYVVTADELPPGAKGLQLETRLNGQVVQSANTDDMLYDVATLISIISEAITLEVGDVIVAGTPSGIGWAREPKLLMRQGDVVEVSIERIGLLRNPIRDEESAANQSIAASAR
ncbi:5-oxopent-3-ene-1,2,5-tricarboxylate decarboxylase [Variovorax sp. WS11]|uniref:fumarylacetoacetate hydrolase family protein n=1 Tax=Variovorax sp. WS11 TaxID=1105204 RepID=UPI000D0DD768|nr:fumarylacetoacetate hydrolase family protein [Variovorax sp. WS11]NDZ17510.1 fumarylacetoacetate hydrolase family protein [Variovorax sp. WS11]PSL85960.1 5-oxopent-3-ene-1,2,5-tricarboxylate decarboxylase [Variovorax sp. WS11]